MTKSAGTINGDGLVKLGIRVPPDVATEFDELRGRDSQAKAGLDAIMLWMALDRDTRAILAGRHPLQDKRKYAAELLDATEARPRDPKRKPRRSRS